MPQAGHSIAHPSNRGAGRVVVDPKEMEKRRTAEKLMTEQVGISVVRSVPRDNVVE